MRDKDDIIDAIQDAQHQLRERHFHPKSGPALVHPDDLNDLKGQLEPYHQTEPVGVNGSAVLAGDGVPYGTVVMFSEMDPSLYPDSVAIEEISSR